MDRVCWLAPRSVCGARAERRAPIGQGLKERIDGTTAAVISQPGRHKTNGGEYGHGGTRRDLIWLELKGRRIMAV